MASKDVQKITINTAKRIIRKLVEYNIKMLKNPKNITRKSQLHTPIFLHSSPGIGKSAVVLQLTEEKKLGFIDLRLSSMEASDLCGVPYVSRSNEQMMQMAIDKMSDTITSSDKDSDQPSADELKAMFKAGMTEECKFSIPSWFPSKERVERGEFPKSGIIFFDELSNAPIAVQHAAYRIILDRELQTGVELADGWLICAAGNLQEDKTGAKKIAPALANRFATHLFIKPDVDEFMQYAYAKDLHHHLTGYLRYKPEHLYRFEPSKNDVAFASPRSWEQASNLLEMGLEGSELVVALNGCIGQGVTSEFVAFRKNYGKLPDFEKIMSGEDKKFKLEKSALDLQCAVTSTLIECMLRNAKDEKKLKNLQYVIAQLPDEFKIMLFKSIKNMAESDELCPIVSNSLENFRKVSKYLGK